MTSFRREKLTNWGRNGDDELGEVMNGTSFKKMANMRISEDRRCPELKTFDTEGLGHFDLYQASPEKEANNNRSEQHSGKDEPNHKCEFVTPFAQSDALLNNVSIKDIYDGSLEHNNPSTCPVARICPAEPQASAAAAVNKRHIFARAKTLSKDFGSCSSSVESFDRNSAGESPNSVTANVELLSCSGKSAEQNSSNKSSLTNASASAHSITPPSCFNGQFGVSVGDNEDIVVYQRQHNHTPCDYASNKSCLTNASVYAHNVTPPSCFNGQFDVSIGNNEDIVYQQEHNHTPCDYARSKVCFGLDSPSTSEDVWESPQQSIDLSLDTPGDDKQTPNVSLTTSPTGSISLFKTETTNRSDPGKSAREADLSNGKQTLTMRISRSLGTFFQKSPSKPSALVEMIDFHETCPEPNYVNVPVPVKEPKRPTSLAGRVVTSIAKLGRKGLFKGASTEATDNDDEEFFNNNKYTPVFVLPENQVDVVDKAPVPLTSEQGKLLRDSWIIIKKDVTEVGVETFIGLFNTHPESIDSFLAFKDKSVQDLERSAVLKAHALRVMQTVDKCITRLDRPERMAALLLQLGKRHVDYQANIKLIPLIGKQFISAIEPKMGPAWTYDLKASWTGLFNIINYNMRQGLMEEKNKRIQAAKEHESGRKKSEEKKKRDRK